MQTKNYNINKPYQILAIKYNSKKAALYLYMSLLFQDFIINNHIKYIKANKKYIVKKDVKIILTNDTNATIIISSYDNKEKYVLNKTNNSFENLENNLLLESDMDTQIYFFYKRNGDLEDLPVTVYKKDIDKNQILLFPSYKKNIYYDFTISKDYKTRLGNLNDIGHIQGFVKFIYPYDE